MVCLYCDGQSATHLARNQNMFHRRTIHIDIKYNFICDKIESKRITLIEITMIDNPTDVMTKPLPCAKFSLCVDLIALTPFNI